VSAESTLQARPLTTANDGGSPRIGIRRRQVHPHASTAFRSAAMILRSSP
jgi:hypothetical protein